MSPKFSRTPRTEGPEYLARWEPHGSCWYLAIYDPCWGVPVSAWTSVPAGEPHPGDEWVEKTGFTPAPGTEWVKDGNGYERPATRPHPSTR